MVNGVLGASGDLVPLPVTEERVPNLEIVTTPLHRMEEIAVTLMGLLMKNPKAVIAELVLV